MSQQFRKQYGSDGAMQEPGRGITFAWSATVPADATPGYAPGCLYLDIDASAGSQVFINQGSATSCAFKAVASAGTTGAANVGLSAAPTGSPGAVTNVQTAITELYANEVTAQLFIPLRLDNWRLVASNDVPAIAVVSGNGGTLAVDTSPKLKRVSTSTDKALRIEWANSTSIEIFQQVFYPPELDVTAAYTINFRIAKSSNTDATCTFTVGCFEGIGDTDRGGATAVLAASALTSYSRSITPTTGHPNFAVFTLTPGTHTTDTIYMYEAYILAKKKILTS